MIKRGKMNQNNQAGRKKVQRKVGALLLATMLFLPLGMLTGAAEMSVNAAGISADMTEQGSVYDEADLLTEIEEQELAEEITALEENTGWTVYAVTTEDTQGKTSMVYADDFYDDHADSEDGVVLLIDMDNREVYLSTAGSAIRYLTDSRIDRITENAASYAGDGDYATCFGTMVGGVEEAYEAGIPSGQYNYDVETGAVSRYHSISLVEVIVALVLGCVVAGIVYASIIGTYRLKLGTYHYDGHRDGKLNLVRKEDRLIHKFVTHHHIQQSSGNGGSGNRSSVHTSSSGRSHGGGGHGF
ncbi:MAG: TPM domain-containing protein [Roseburia sp.]